MLPNARPTWHKWIAALLAILAVLVIASLPARSQLLSSSGSGSPATAESDTLLALAKTVIVQEGEIEKLRFVVDQLKQENERLKPSGLARFWNDNKFLVGAVIGGWLVSQATD